MLHSQQSHTPTSTTERWSCSHIFPSIMNYTYQTEQNESNLPHSFFLRYIIATMKNETNAIICHVHSNSIIWNVWVLIQFHKSVFKDNVYDSTFSHLHLAIHLNGIIGLLSTTSYRNESAPTGSYLDNGGSQLKGNSLCQTIDNLEFCLTNPEQDESFCLLVYLFVCLRQGLQREDIHNFIYQNYPAIFLLKWKGPAVVFCNHCKHLTFNLLFVCYGLKEKFGQSLITLPWVFHDKSI